MDEEKTLLLGSQEPEGQEGSAGESQETDGAPASGIGAAPDPDRPGPLARCPECMGELPDGAEECPLCGHPVTRKPKEPYQLCPGMRLKEGRYLLGHVVGFGGFGILYRAWDQKLERKVAVKEYYPVRIVNRVPGQSQILLYTGSGSGEFQKGLSRFLDEARNTAQFNREEHIVHVFDFFEENGTAYMVMEFLEGGSFADELRENQGRVSCDRALEVLLCIAQALKPIHRAGIIHRDISPDNIFICSDGKIKLLDFGAARFSDGSAEKDLTRVLKMGYAPPEQYRTRGKQGPWTDVYALGATAYRALTGRIPEESSDREKKDLLKPPSEYRKDIPRYLDRAIMKAMALIPEYRFQNVTDLERGMMGKRNLKGLDQEIRLRKSLRAAGIAAAAVCIAIAGGTGFHIYENRKTEAKLGQAHVSIWIPSEGKEEQRQREIFDAAVQEFREAYPEVTMDIRFMGDTYWEELSRALQNGAGPDLFRSEGLGPEADVCLADLGALWELASPQEYYFLSDFETWIPSKNRLPASFEANVLYINTVKSEEQEEMSAENSKEAFLKGDSLCYVGMTGDYPEIQDTLPGRYEIKALDEEDSFACFGDVWSVNDGSEEDVKRAAVRILYYLIGENAQDEIYVVNQGGIPVEKREAETYLEVNQELSFLTERLEGLPVAAGEEAKDRNNRIYKAIRQSNPSLLTGTDEK